MICLPCRSTRGNAACQPAIKLQCWDNRSALPMRDPRTSIRCAPPALLARKKSVRRPACTDVRDQQISAGFRTASRHLNFGRLARGITPLRVDRRRITLSPATLASVKVSKTAPDKPFGDVTSDQSFADHPRIAGHNLPINMIRQSLPRLPVPCGSGSDP